MNNFGLHCFKFHFVPNRNFIHLLYLNPKAMKKILHLFVLALLLIPTTSVLAADDDDKQFYKGIRVGYQGSNIDNSDMGDLTSFYVGFFGVKRIGAGKLLSIYSGLEYFQNGATDDEDNKIVLGYLSIPINLRVQIGPVYAFGGFPQ